MVPASSVLRNSELVGETVAGGNWALSDSVDSVKFKGLVLSSAVEVKGCTVVLQMVLHSDFKPISPAGFDVRTRILLVESLTAAASTHTICIDGVIGCVEMILTLLDGIALIGWRWQHERLTVYLSNNTGRPVEVNIREDVIDASCSILRVDGSL